MERPGLPQSFTTSKGSVYTYLPDGRVERFKTATGERFDKADICVFYDGTDPYLQQAVVDSVYSVVQTVHTYLVDHSPDGTTFPARLTDIKDPSKLEVQVWWDGKDGGEPELQFRQPVQLHPAIGLSPLEFKTTEIEPGFALQDPIHAGNAVTSITN